MTDWHSHQRRSWPPAPVCHHPAGFPASNPIQPSVRRVGVESPPQQRHFHICSDLNLHVCTSANMFLSVFKISLLTLHNVLWWSLRKQDCRCFMFKQKCDGARLQLGLSYALVPSFPFFNAFNHLSLKWKILKRTIFAMYCKIRFPHDTFFFIL